MLREHYKKIIIDLWVWWVLLRSPLISRAFTNFCADYLNFQLIQNRLYLGVLKWVGGTQRLLSAFDVYIHI